ncbi:MAG: hypothetical protein AABX11_02590 [Nanoarchaeota archaeon]
MALGLVERHYTPTGITNTRNLSGVLKELPAERYQTMVQRINLFATPTISRGLGSVIDETKYYTFSGSNVFLDNGLAQAGTAVTSDNQEGFPMIRLFANSSEQMEKLELECGLRF